MLMSVQSPTAAAHADFPLGQEVSEQELVLIEHRLSSLEGVRRVRLHKEQRRAQVGFDPAQVSVEALRAAAQP